MIAREILEDDTDIVAQIVKRVVLQIDAVEKDAAFARIVEPREKLDDRRLAGAVFADKGKDLARLQCEIEMADRPMFGIGIFEADILEAKALGDGRRECVWLVRATVMRGSIAKKEKRSSR